MTAIRTSLENAFETQLTAEMGPNDLTAQVASLGTLTSPCYVVIDMDDDAKREYILFDGTFGALQFAASNINRRYLAGSAVGSNITHLNGANVRVAAVAQHIEDLHDRIDGIEHGDLQGLATGDPHPQYFEVADHTTTLHNTLNIDADTLDGQHAIEFAASGHNHGSEYAPESHVDSTDGHPNATTSSAGLMSAQDKLDLQNALGGGGQDNQDIDSGVGITLSPPGPTSGDVTISHAAPGASDTYLDYNGPGGAIDAVDIDANGHVRSLSGKTITPGSIGAYTDTEVDNLFVSPNFTGVIDLDTTKLLDNTGGFTELWANASQANGAILRSDGGSQLYLGQVQFAGGAFNLECDESGDYRRIKYDNHASARRFKDNIRPTSFRGGECLKWAGSDFVYIRDVQEFGDDAPTKHWYVAEDILADSGEDFIKRNDEGAVLNTNDRAMLLDVIITLQDAVEEIQTLKARIAELEA